jgi:hypothetical protein
VFPPLCGVFAGIPSCVIVIRRRVGIFRLRSFFALRRSCCAQDDSVWGEMGLLRRVASCGVLTGIRAVVVWLKPCLFKARGRGRPRYANRGPSSEFHFDGCTMIRLGVMAAIRKRIDQAEVGESNA